MAEKYTYEQTIKSCDLEDDHLPGGEYEACRFVGLELSGANLGGHTFTDCVFEQCNLSLCKMAKTGLKSVTFKDSKLMGIRWDDANPFLLSLRFEGCRLDMSSFYGMRLNKTKWINCSLAEVDFSEAQLSEADFSDSTLTKSVFDQSNLSKCDFRTATEYQLDPEVNILAGARFSWPGLAGLLVKYRIRIDH